MKRGKWRKAKNAQGRAYAIGYAKPPVTSRFKPGQSGNAKGRPKGHKNLKTLIKQAMTAMITVQEGSSGRRVTKLEGVVLRQLLNALKGNDRSAMAGIKMATEMGFLEDASHTNSAEDDLTVSDERILKELFARRHRAKR